MDVLDAAPASAADSTAPATLQGQAQGLLDHTQTLIEGEELMFTMDVPYIPPQDAPVVLAQAAATTSQPDYLLKTCDEASSGGEPAIDPAAWLVTAVLRQNGRQVSAIELNALVATVKLTQLQGVEHGNLTPHSPDGRVFYKYRSEPGYVGKDQAIFMAEYEGKRYKIIANVVVSMTINENDPQCPIRPTLIKITKPSSGDSGFGSGYTLGSVTINIADLTGGAVGQAVGTTITLDDNASGYGWFIDPTPWDNSEYLPTRARLPDNQQNWRVIL